ncbi:MAG: HU family DNA-binding protein [Lachnospiraceae bacterium]|nr:HU family DNA-binding protein [Lachnospiraceae bacterium]MDE7176502.1 HU family DNA-binding protein [Lachnospiraceae bacterium]
MNKVELIEAISNRTNITKKDTEKIVNAYTQVVMEELKRGGKVQLIGFGTFDCVKAAPRIGRNPQTGVTMPIPARRLPKFRPGKLFKDMLKS